VNVLVVVFAAVVEVVARINTETKPPPITRVAEDNQEIGQARWPVVVHVAVVVLSVVSVVLSSRYSRCCCCRGCGYWCWNSLSLLLSRWESSFLVVVAVVVMVVVVVVVVVLVVVVGVVVGLSCRGQNCHDYRREEKFQFGRHLPYVPDEIQGGIS